MSGVWLRGVGIGIPLVGLLTWLLINSVGPLGQDYVFAQRDVARVSLAEAALQRDVLLARADLLHDYDPLDADMADLRNSAKELRSQARIRPVDSALLDRLNATVDQEADALEQFKSGDALRQNSLSYFSMLDERLAATTTDQQTASALAALGDAVLHLTRFPGPAGVAQVRKQLEAVSAFATANGNQPPSREMSLLLVHGQRLTSLLPSVDANLRSLFQISTFDVRQAIRISQDFRRSAEERRAAWFRLSLFTVAILLAGVVIRVGLQRLAGLRLLRHRSEVEASLNALSARTLETSPEDFETMLDEVVAALGGIFGADRAYLVSDELDTPVRSWSRLDRIGSHPIDWLRHLLHTAQDGVSSKVDGVHHVPDIARGAPDPQRDLLLLAGVGSWCAVPIRMAQSSRGLLGFELLHANPSWPRTGTGLMRMAADLMQNAMQRHQAASEREQLERRLGRSGRLEAIGEFASGIAHNFNNLIGAMLGHAEMAAEMLTSPKTGPSSAGQHLQEIVVAGQRAHTLVGRILDYGTRVRSQHSVFSVDLLLAETLAMLRAMAPDRIEIVAEPEAPGRLIRGDAVQLQQVLLNLGRNGFEAMPEGGMLTLAVDVQRNKKERPVSHDVLPPGDFVRFRVMDDGVGIEPVTLASIFQPFFTTRSTGTGLGLATVLEIVHDNQGVIDVRSLYGRGSVFSIWLPVATSDLPPEQEVPSRTGRTILLLAPDTTSVLHDEEMLAALGYEPIGFSDPDLATAAALSTPERFDFLLVSLLGRNTDRLKVTRALREALPATALLLVVTGSTEPRLQELADLRVGAVLYRPLRSRSLQDALAECSGDIAGR